METFKKGIAAVHYGGTINEKEVRKQLGLSDVDRLQIKTEFQILCRENGSYIEIPSKSNIEFFDKIYYFLQPILKEGCPPINPYNFHTRVTFHEEQQRKAKIIFIRIDDELRGFLKLDRGATELKLYGYELSVPEDEFKKFILKLYS